MERGKGSIASCDDRIGTRCSKDMFQYAFSLVLSLAERLNMDGGTASRDDTLSMCICACT